MTMRIFFHRDLLADARSSPVVSRRKLVNFIHHLHFTGRPLFVHVNDPEYDEDYLIQGCLTSCTEHEIRCRLPQEVPTLPANARVLHLIADDGRSVFLIPVRTTGVDGPEFTAAMPETGYLSGQRRVRRHACRNIDVTLTQSGLTAQGVLIDFTPLAFRVRMAVDPGASFIWLNREASLTACLRKAGRIVFSGPCRCVRQTGDLQAREMVLAPLREGIKRYRKQKIRAPRLRPVPALSVHFEHPCWGKPVQRDVTDLSFGGFSIEEPAEDAALMPGLIIPDLEIRSAGAVDMTCTAQVIYRRQAGRGNVRCGFAILDMDFRSYRRLSHIMVHAGDPSARFSCDMEMDALWEFFFDTGFIYPKKYRLIQSSREAFKDTYRRLYREDQDIEAHFTLQQNDRVYGHVSIFRAYQRAWMVHHLAARPLNGKRTGLFVLKNILKFFDGLYRYPSIRIDHMMFYFRPENYFPDLFFGGFARSFGNPRACSLDLFAYLTHAPPPSASPLPPGWRIEAFDNRCLRELERFYRNASGGLLLEALRLGRPENGCEPLEEVYRRHGFLRQWRVHALFHEQSPKAVLIVNRTSPGLNLSELLNSVTVLAIDPTGLPWPALSAAVDELARIFDAPDVPLMIYPAAYPEQVGRTIEKHYFLWILDTQYGREYGEYMDRATRFSLRFLVQHLLKKLVPR